MTGTVDVTNLRADAIAVIARLGGSVDQARQFFHPGWKNGTAGVVSEGLYAELRADLRKPAADSAFLLMHRLWRLVHSPLDWYCTRCMDRATQPPGMGHVTVADIGEVCADDLCAECLNRPTEPAPPRFIRLGEAS
jgi:hypothetical protein